MGIGCHWRPAVSHHLRGRRQRRAAAVAVGVFVVRGATMGDCLPTRMSGTGGGVTRGHRCRLRRRLPPGAIAGAGVVFVGRTAACGRRRWRLRR